MATLLEKIADIQTLIDDLEALAFGDDTTSVTHSGQTRDSVSKAIKSKFDALQAMVQGRLTYATKAAMDAAGAPPAGELAEVWNDPVADHNVIYGWNGSSWQASTLTAGARIKAVENIQAGQKNLPSATGYTPSATDDLGVVLAAYINGQMTNVLGYDDAGRLNFDVTDSTAINLYSKALSGLGFSVAKYATDEEYVLALLTGEDNPRVMMSVAADGTVTTGGSSYPGLNLANQKIIYHIVNDGQSQSVGSTALPVLTPPAAINGYLMPNGNLTTIDDFYPLKPGGEVQWGSGSTTRGESPASAIIESLLIWLKNERGISVPDKKMKFAASNPGVGGTEIAKFAPGGVYADRFFDQVFGIKTAAERDGYQYQIHAYTWTQGGSDMNDGTSYQSYYDDFVAIRSDREQQLRQAFNQPVKLHCITWQMGARIADGELKTLDVPNALLQASKDVPEIHVCCPFYHFQFNDAAHLTNISSKALGYYMQRVYREVVLLGNTWKPLQPESITATGQTISIEYNVPDGPLVFDREIIKKTPTNEGFIVRDHSGDLTITDVRIVAGCRVEIDVAEVIGTNPRLSYAEFYTDSGYAASDDHPRGTLRDSAGLTEKYTEYEVDDNGAPTVVELHNFCVTFNEPIIVS